MRIGFDAKRAFNNRTGLGNYSRFIIAGMLEHFPQHEYVLFTPSVKPEFANLFAQYANVQVVTPQGWWGKRFKSFWRTYVISRLSKKLKLDVYHGLSNELPAGITNFQGKKIVTIHDLIFLRYPQYYKPIDRFIYRRKFAKACSSADVIVAASRQTANDITTYFGVPDSKMVIGYQNCAAHFNQLQPAAALAAVRVRYQLPAKYIVCIGTVEDRKRQLLLLKAYHQLNPTEDLVFVGKRTSYASRLDEYISAHSLQNRVKFIEGASFEDFPAFYRMASLAVYVSEFEGFGIPILEALRCGAQVVAAHTSSLTEVGGEAVHYTSGDTAEELAATMKHALQHPIAPDILQAQAEKFNTRELLVELLSVYAGKSS